MGPNKVVAKGMRERYNRIILMCMIFTTGFTHLKHTGVEFSIYLLICATVTTVCFCSLISKASPLPFNCYHLPPQFFIPLSPTPPVPPHKQLLITILGLSRCSCSVCSIQMHNTWFLWLALFTEIMNIITVSRFIHLSHISAFFFFVAESYPIVWMDHLLRIHHQLAAHLEKETLGLCDELLPQPRITFIYIDGNSAGPS